MDEFWTVLKAPSRNTLLGSANLPKGAAGRFITYAALCGCCGKKIVYVAYVLSAKMDEDVVVVETVTELYKTTGIGQWFRNCRLELQMDQMGAFVKGRAVLYGDPRDSDEYFNTRPQSITSD